MQALHFAHVETASLQNVPSDGSAVGALGSYKESLHILFRLDVAAKHDPPHPLLVSSKTWSHVSLDVRYPLQILLCMILVLTWMNARDPVVPGMLQCGRKFDSCIDHMLNVTPMGVLEGHPPAFTETC